MANPKSHRAFRAAFGNGPWPCCFCGELVTSLAQDIVHHHDNNRANNNPTNLGASHVACHVRHHHQGKQVGAATRAKLSQAGKGRRLTDEHKAKLSAAHRGTKKPWVVGNGKPTPERNAKRSAALKGRPWSAARRAAEDRRHA